MSRQYIDFISAYCDGWCERCAFTERCSQFAVKSALAMCDGNFEAAFELAVGPARTPGGPSQPTLDERMAEVLGDYEPSGKELADIGRVMEERRERVRQTDLAEWSKDYAVASRRWLHARAGTDHPDPAVREAIEAIRWDSLLIHVKIMRALNGRDEDPGGHWFDNDPVQSDWNGSAKVALLSIDRSHAAWRTIGAAIRDDGATALADNLHRLRQELDKQFPRARQFRRPGFDDPNARAR
jgi:hypothetical protein